MGNLKRQLADLQKQVHAKPAHQEPGARLGPILSAATREELCQFNDLAERAQARRAAGALPLRPLPPGWGSEASAEPPPFAGSWLSDAEFAEVNAIFAAWKGRARSSTAEVCSATVAAARAELQKRAAQGSGRTRPVHWATAAERRRARKILQQCRAKLAAGPKPAWCPTGLEITHLDLLTDAELEELVALVKAWSARATGHA